MTTAPPRLRPSSGGNHAWTKAGLIFQGGTDAVKKLIGRQVRSIGGGSLFIYDSEKDGLGAPLRVAPGTIGFVANSWKTSVLIAIPGGKVDSFAPLQRSGSFAVIAVDWNDFKSGFEIET